MTADVEALAAFRSAAPDVESALNHGLLEKR
jgi:hypothetical protein